MSDPAPAASRFSVIIPAWNDQGYLGRLLPELVRLKAVGEVIVADASPQFATARMAREAGAIYLPAPQPNRGAQLNQAAANATGDAFIFHHADSILTANHVGAICQAFRDPQIVGGAFYRKFDRRHPWLCRLEIVARFLTRHGGSFFGDQSIFVRREIFRALGGFASIPLMEDIEFSRRLRRFGKVAVLDPPLESSQRRHLERGAWRTSLQNGLFIALYKCGLSPAQLHRWYYRERQFLPNESLATAQSIEEFGGR